MKPSGLGGCLLVVSASKPTPPWEIYFCISNLNILLWSGPGHKITNLFLIVQNINLKIHQMYGFVVDA